jgi:hypothetical protein
MPEPTDLGAYVLPPADPDGAVRLELLDAAGRRYLLTLHPPAPRGPAAAFHPGDWPARLGELA